MDVDQDVRTRLDSFRLGGTPPMKSTGHVRSHSRSHSRNLSFSTTSPSDPSLSLFSLPSSTNLNLNAPPPPPTNKRNSHHRRRSSVSTRTESAELMGVSLPDLPQSNSDTNVNFGDKDSIRRRALWALEGKTDVAFSKVEIPDITTPHLDTSSFDFPTKPSFTPGSGGSCGSGLPPLLGNKRDSFKLLAGSSSSKDQLHTLVEEEEEEEEEEDEEEEAQSITQEVLEPVMCDSPTILDSTLEGAPVTSIAVEEEAQHVVPISSRPRPATLNLRPLSLTPQNLVTIVHGLPMPSWTTSPRPGMRSLSLSSTLPDDDTLMKRSDTTTSCRRPSLNLNLGSNDRPIPAPASDGPRPGRRSSIIYKAPSHGVTTSAAGLPTPEMTPTYNRRFSLAESVPSAKSNEDSFSSGTTQSRPLSVSEQHFLVESHNTLLARITDLERALTMRRRSSSAYSRPDSINSRPVSMFSDFSSDVSSEPSDEMLMLIADLKAERDELKKDVDGWRTRVGDMEKQLTLLAKRVENERRDAWIARSQVGLLEVEKGVVDKKLKNAEHMLQVVIGEKQELQAEKDVLATENGELEKRTVLLEKEVSQVKMELEKERGIRRKRATEQLPTPTDECLPPRPRSSHGRDKADVFTSIDSAESSATEVDSSDDCQARFNFILKAVQEEDEYNSDEEGSEDNNGLAGYEDSEDSDISFHSTSSFDSSDDQPATPYQPSTPSTPKPRSLTFENTADADSCPSPHQSGASWSTWTFPRTSSASHKNKQESVDHFFGCLQDNVSNESSSVPSSPSQYSFERSKNLFAEALKSEVESPFFLPTGVGVVVEVAEDKHYGGATVENTQEYESSDDGSDGEMFGEMGGIRITLSPPRPEDDELVIEPKQLVVQTIKRLVDKPPQLPMLNFGFEDDDEDFNFGRTLEHDRSPVNLPRAVSQTPPSAIPRPTSPRAASPSGIPRPAVFKPLPPSDTSTKIASASSPPPSTFVTPPTRRGGTIPSFIPQAVSSPSPVRTASIMKTKLTGTSAFIRQPQRLPLMVTGVNNVASNSGTRANAFSAMNHRDTPLFARSSETEESIYKYNNQARIMKSIDLTLARDASARQNDTSTTDITPTPGFASIMTTPIAAKLSLSSFTSLIPFSWSTSRTPTPIISPSTSVSSKPTLASHDNMEDTLKRSYVTHNRGFVSRQKQLEKLKSRMEVEGQGPMYSLIELHCKNCTATFIL